MKLILFFLLFIPVAVYSQNKVFGKVVDEKTNEPVSFASVYINSTTFGTITDNLGNFSLKGVVFPCELIVSHVSYQVKPIVIKEIHDSLMIKLLERQVLIDEVNVNGINLREQNFNTFKNWFLGADNWGKNATVRNDSSLLYKHDYKKQTVVITLDYLDRYTRNKIQGLRDIQWAEDSSFYTYMKEVIFTVRSKAPLIIDMPLLGYTLRLDLVYAVTKSNNTFKTCSFLGYYYFEPIKPKNKRAEKRFSKNRKLVYYNSSMHFCRSFYSNELDLNGYRLFEEVKLGTNKSLRAINLDTCLIPVSDNLKGIIGLKDRCFNVLYYPEANGEPKVILNSRNDTNLQSKIYFLSDTCYIRSDGTIPDFSILFTESIGNKKIGTMLPGNYQPGD